MTEIIPILTHLFGFISVLLFLYSDMQEDDHKLDKLYTYGNFFFLLHLIFIGSFIPAITVFLAILRNTLNIYFPNSKYIKWIFITIFSTIFILATLKSEHFILAFPAAVSLIMTYAFLYTKGNLLTLLSILCSVLWWLVGYYIQSYSIMVLEIISVLLLFYRFYKQNFMTQDNLSTKE